MPLLARRPPPPSSPEHYAIVRRLRQSLSNAARHAPLSSRLLVIGAILVLVFLAVRPGLPTTVRVSFRLPRDVRALSVDYEQGGELVRTARFGWSGPSPEVLRHEPELAPGSTTISVTLRDVRGQTRSVRRRIEVGADRLARVDLR